MSKLRNPTTPPGGVTHRANGEVVKHEKTTLATGRTIPREKFREIANRVLTDHKPALDWLKNK